MPTLSAGVSTEVYVPVSGSMTVTPGAGGRVRVDVSVRQGMAPVDVVSPIHSARTFSVPGGATVFLEAIGAAASYSSVPGDGKAQGSYTSMRLPYLKTSTSVNDAAGFTYQTIAAAEAPFNLVRVGFLNAEASPVTMSKAIAGARGAVTTGAANWYNVTFGGAASVVLPARLGTNRPSITMSDWIPLQSIARSDGLGSACPLFYLRCFFGPAQTTFSQTTSADSLAWLAATSPAGPNGGRIWRTERQNVDAVTTPANWTAGVQVNHALPLVIEFAHTVKSFSVLNGGDSIRVGTVADIAQMTNGDAFRACISMSTPDRPVSLVNAGWGGDSSDNYTNRTIDLIEALSPDVVIFCPFSPNDGTPAGYRTSLQLGQYSRVLKAAKAVGAKVIAVSGMCNTSHGWDATADNLRKDLNATLAAMEFPLIDQDLPASDGATPARFAAGTSADGLHANAAVYAAITPMTIAALSAVLPPA